MFPCLKAMLFGLVVTAPAFAQPLQPVVQLNNQEYSCEPQPEGCSIDNLGTLYADAESLNLRFEARVPVAIQGLGWTGAYPLAGARGLLSNGFQSWSLSGNIRIPGHVSPARLSQALDIRTDENRSGDVMSWEYSAVTGTDAFILVGALTSLRFKPWVQWTRLDANTVALRLSSGNSGESINIAAGASIEGEDWYFESGDLERMDASLRAYASRLGGRGLSPHVGWNSWYDLWSGVSESSYLENREAARSFLSMQPLPRPERPIFVLDDGWAKRWGDWQTNAKFPSGLSALAAEVRAGGLEPGIWLAPFLVSVDSDLIKQHPQWFVVTADYEHPSGRYRILDLTHPEVQTHLAGVLRTLVAHGFNYLKIDFLYVAAFEGGRFQAMTGMQAYNLALKFIRDTVGNEVFLLACGAPQLASRPYVNSWRSGPDIAFEFPSGQLAWGDVGIQLQNLGARWFLCAELGCDADPLLLRQQRSATSMETMAWVQALTGQGIMLSDDLRQVSPWRRELRLSKALTDQAMSGAIAAPQPVMPLHLPAQLVGLKWWERLNNTLVAYPPRRWRLPNGTMLDFDLRLQRVTASAAGAPQ